MKIMKKIEIFKIPFLALMAIISSIIIITSTSQISVLLNNLFQELNDYGIPVKNTIRFFCIVYILRAVFKLVRNHITAYIGNYSVNVFRESAIRSLIQTCQEPKELAKEYSILTYDLTAITELLSWRTFVFLEDMMILFLAIRNIWRFQPSIAIFITFMLLIILTVSFVLGACLQTGIKSMKDSISDLSGFMRENILNQKIVRAYNAQNQQYKRFQSICEENKKSQQVIRDENKKWIPMMEGLAQSALFLSLGVGIVFVIIGKNTIGFLALLNGYLFLLTSVAADIGNLMYFFVNSRDSVKRLLSIFLIKKQNCDKIGGIIGDYCLNLSITAPVLYADDTPLLRNINVDFKEGEITVIRGATGSGKTVLTDSITGLRFGKDFEIYWNDKAISEVCLEEYWSHIGYALQKPVFFRANIQDNILLWKTGISEQWLEQLKESLCLDFIDGLECGFETMINSDSNFLSGGEKQRICLARALAANPQIIVVDDALQAIDKRIQKKILKFFSVLKRNHIIIIVSSDEDILEYADCIYQIEGHHLKREERGDVI